MEEYFKLKKENNENQNNNDSVSKAIEIAIRICLGGLFIAIVTILIISIMEPENSLIYIPLVVGMLALCVFIILDKVERNRNLAKYVELGKQKVDILDDLLLKKYGISTKEKVNELLMIYQNTIEEKKSEEKNRNKTLGTLYSAFAGILTISFSNLDVIEIDFEMWMRFALLLLIFLGGASFYAMVCTQYDPIKRKYSIMIKDLEEVRLLKY